MPVDLVACTWCMEVSEVDAYEGTCPKCNEDGYLMYAEDAGWIQKDEQWYWSVK